MKIFKLMLLLLLVAMSYQINMRIKNVQLNDNCKKSKIFYRNIIDGIANFNGIEGGDSDESISNHNCSTSYSCNCQLDTNFTPDQVRAGKLVSGKGDSAVRTIKRKCNGVCKIKPGNKCTKSLTGIIKPSDCLSGNCNIDGKCA